MQKQSHLNLHSSIWPIDIRPYQVQPLRARVDPGAITQFAQKQPYFKYDWYWGFFAVLAYPAGTV